MFRKSTLVLCMLLLAFAGRGENSVFRHYTVAEGLASSTVYFIFQDTKGYLWLCTEAGVNRYDGKRMETFTTADGLADNENFKCFEDSRGRIWFLSYNGHLSYFNDTGFVNERADPGLAYPVEQGRYLVDMVEDGAGHIWFSTLMGNVFEWDGRRVVSKTLPFALGSYMLFLDNNKNAIVFLPTPNRTATLRMRDSKTTVLHVKGGSVPAIGYISKQQLGSDWYFTASGNIACIRGDSVIPSITAKEIGAQVSCFSFTGNDVWIGSAGKGLFRWRDLRRSVNTQALVSYLDSAMVSCIQPDNEGGIWVATMSDGVYYLPASQTSVTQIIIPSATSISHSSNSSLWAAGTYNGDVQIYNGSKLAKSCHYNRYPQTRIKSLKWLSGDELIIGMDYNPYLLDWRANKVRELFAGALPGTSDLFQDGSGLWICSRSNVNQLKDGAVANIPGSQVNGTDKLVALCGDGTGNCWFASVSRLFFLQKDGQMSKEMAGPEVFGANLKDIAWQNGQLWVATHGNGVFVFRESKQVAHLKASGTGLVSDICHVLHCDGKERIWVGTAKGVSVFHAPTFRFLFNLTLNDVLLSNDVLDIDTYGDTAYIATPAGVTIVGIVPSLVRASPPELYVEGFEYGNGKFNGLSSPGIPYSNSAAVLSFKAITFQAGQLLKYRYRMSGADGGWSESSNDKIVFYDLSPGTYTLELSARKYNSDWSMPVTYTFSILPLWYQDSRFRVSVAIVLVILFVAGYRRQVSVIRRRAQEQTAYHKKIADLESNALANQMNPHFIFNSLNTVQQFMLLKEEKQGIAYLNEFSRLIRQILQYSKQEYIRLDQEISFLKRYLELEQIRFNQKFTFTFRVAGVADEEEVRIPPMLVQPLLENAVKHGLRKEGGHIAVSMQLDGDMLLVVIEDDGYGIEKVREEALKQTRDFDSTALKVIEGRLKLMVNEKGQKGSVSIKDRSWLGNGLQGTRVQLEIPVKS